MRDDRHAKGLAIAAIGGMALTIDIPLVRLAGGDIWSILMLRGGTTLLATFAIWLILAARRKQRPVLIQGRSGLLVASLYGAAYVSFILAVFNTSAGNVVFILALNSMFCALLGWLFLGERPRMATLFAVGAMLIGVLIIVHDSIGHGHLVGDACALASSLLLASAITLTRASGKDMSMAALVAFVAPFVLGLAMVSQTGLRVEQPFWIILDGLVVLPLSFFCLATGPKYISGPEVAMFYLLEAVMTPIWIWMIFTEVPSMWSLIGGGILILTLAWHSIWLLRQAR